MVDALINPDDQRMLLFDFGNMISFDLTVIRIGIQEAPPDRPILVEQKGDTPDFYCAEWD